MKGGLGHTAMPPHNPKSVPKTCWTCIKHQSVLYGMTTCYLIKDNSNHTKLGVEACDSYEQDPIWLESAWWYP